MTLGAMMILAFGPLDWTFPWWMWALAILSGLGRDRTIKDGLDGIANALRR